MHRQKWLVIFIPISKNGRLNGDFGHLTGEIWWDFILSGLGYEKIGQLSGMAAYPRAA